MINEYNGGKYQESASFKENETAREINKSASDFYQAKVNAPPKETSLHTKKNHKKSTGKKGKGVALANMLVATVVTVTTTVGSGIINPRKATVEMKEQFIGLTEICYQIEVIETEAELTVTLENDFTNRQKGLTVGVNEVEFTELAPNMEYTLSVKFIDGLKETVEKRKVKTNGENPKPEPEPQPDPEPSVPTTEWIGFEYVSATDKDGEFLFTPLYKDDFGIWKSLEITLYDQYYENQIYEDIQESGKEYSINLSGAEFVTSEGHVEVWAYVIDPSYVPPEGSTDDGGQYEKVFEQDVVITQTVSKINSVVVQKAEDDNTLRLNVEYLDENGYWQEQTNGDDTYKFVVVIYDPNDNSSEQEDYISSINQVAEFVLQADEYLNGTATIKIYCYNEYGMQLLIYSEEDVEIIGENFQRN